jgi:hypothetical protein
MTYDSAAAADADRVQQKTLLAALDAWDRALRRDECGAWTISGKNGTVHTWGDGKTWAVYAHCSSGKQWAYSKKRMSFCKVTQDGDDEGVFRLHQLPTPEQAEVIRDVVGIRKRMKMSPTTLERLRAFSFEPKPRSEPRNPADIALTEAPPSEPPPNEAVPIFDADLVDLAK